MLYNVLWCTDSHSADCCKYPRGEHVKSGYTLSVKRLESQDMAPCFSASEVPFTQLFMFVISSPLCQSTLLWWEGAISAHCGWIVLLSSSFDLHLRIRHGQRMKRRVVLKSGDIAWRQSVFQSLMHHCLLQKKKMCKQRQKKIAIYSKLNKWGLLFNLFKIETISASGDKI